MLKTLIVEDNADFRRTFKEALGKRFPHLVIEEAADGNEAMQKIEAFLPDMLFMDIRLPGESGLELTKRIKENYPGIVVIILTNYDLPEYRNAAYDGGADYFIPKASLNLADVAEFIKSKFPDTVRG